MKVLISPGYGAGWSTWNEPGLATDARIIDAFERGISREEMKQLCIDLGYTGGFEGTEPYMGGFEQLQIVEVPAGTIFRVDEYDGSESIEVFSDSDWQCAV